MNRHTSDKKQKKGLYQSITENFSRSLSPPMTGVASQDRSAKTLITINVILIVATIWGAFMTSRHGFISPTTEALMIGCTIFTASFIVHKRGHYTLSAIGILFGLWLTNTYGGVFRGQQADDFNAILYTLQIALAALLLGTRGAVFHTFIVYVTILGLGMIGVFGDGFPQGSIFRFGFSFIVLGIILSTLTRNLGKAVEDVVKKEMTLYQKNIELVKTQARLQSLNNELEQRIAERTDQLRVAKDEAEIARDQALQADQTKSQFLASMSHELRTPLNSMLMFIELIQLGALGEVNLEQKEYLGKSFESGQHLLSLINDVLDITKIQSGMITLFVEDDFDVLAEMKNVWKTTESLVEDKPVEVVIDLDSQYPPITCDKRRVRQVLLNLASNAAKFTQVGTITFSTKVDGDYLLFAVMDTGPGISKEQQDIIFEPFIQTESGIKHSGGTGLGLPISRNLIEIHGGKLWVESELGDGCAFFFTLPLIPIVKVGEKDIKNNV